MEATMDFEVVSQLVWAALAPTWRRERIECFVEMLRGLFLAQSVNTHRLAQRMGGDVQFASVTQRIRRLLSGQMFDWEVIGRLMLAVAGVNDVSKVVVVVDRTNWDFGRHAINFLVISVVVNGVGVPVVWEQLGKKGNSKTKERVDLLERFLHIIPAKRITVFLADREFIGKGWFETLQNLGIPYVIRVRANQFVTLPDGHEIKISALAKTLKHQRPQTWPKILLGGVPCSLSLKRLPDGKLLAVVAHGLKKSANALDIYRQRWGIELCFACLKTKGFNLEDTHLRHKDRLEKIFALASLAAAAALRASLTAIDRPAKKNTAMPRDPLSCVA
jgi:hypothetical protein